MVNDGVGGAFVEPVDIPSDGRPSLLGLDEATTLTAMSKISLIAKITAAEGKAEELEAVMANLIAAAEEEAGLEVYSAHADRNEPGVFYFFELYQGEDALKVHGKGDAMKATMGAMGSLLGGRPEVTMLDPIVAKGLSL